MRLPIIFVLFLGIVVATPYGIRSVSSRLNLSAESLIYLSTDKYSYQAREEVHYCISRYPHVGKQSHSKLPCHFIGLNGSPEEDATVGICRFSIFTSRNASSLTA